jgi:RPA family protein
VLRPVLVSAVDSEGRTIWIVDSYRGDGKRYVVRADEKLTAFLELERQVSNSVKR